MSLNLRIILSATLVLIIFITLTAAALDRAFYSSTESALRDKLTSQLYALMAAAEITDSNIIMPSSELDILLGLPSSGVYAFITDKNRNILWQSSSVLSANPPQAISLNSGENKFIKATFNNKNYYSYAFGVNWLTDNNRRALTFNIITERITFDKQISQYRSTLWGWLLAMAALLLITQAFILRWGLLPLRKVGEELNSIEDGKQTLIENNYPAELEPLTRNINILLGHEREQKTRYRNALGDLAHSLKTPLAVLQNALNNNESNNVDTMQDQISRMNSTVEYQLQRAATAGASSVCATIDVALIIQRINASLLKVYADKHIHIKTIAADSLLFKCEEGDMMELLGNLLDNAFKWADSKIEIIAERRGQQLFIKINDDGPGIETQKINELLQRGMRADQSVAGHGIGLSIVRNIINAYQGQLKIKTSSLGGASIQIIL